jgi:hypothetical protein
MVVIWRATGLSAFDSVAGSGKFVLSKICPIQAFQKPSFRTALLPRDMSAGFIEVLNQCAYSSALGMQ